MDRRRSLLEDTRDRNRFYSHRDSKLGISISNEFYQQAPMFFTRENAQINLIGHYRGAHAFMICNGPSFSKLDHSLLKKPGVITYGMNNGPRTFRPNFWTCVDSPHRFIKSIWLDPTITKFVPHEYSESNIYDSESWEKMKVRVGECPNVYYYHRNEKFVAKRFLFEDKINWGNHKQYGGGRTVMLPVLRILFLLGFRHVYLLGADFKMDTDYTYHFDEQRHDGAVNNNRNTYERLKNEYLPQLKPIFEQEGFNVYNCNPESGLQVFPFLDYEEAINRATSSLGNIAEERTWGMYSDEEKKKKWAVEPEITQKHHLKNIHHLAGQFKEAMSGKITVKRPKVPLTSNDLEKQIERSAAKNVVTPEQIKLKKDQNTKVIIPHNSNLFANDSMIKVEYFEGKDLPPLPIEKPESKIQSEIPPKPQKLDPVNIEEVVEIPTPPTSMREHITIFDTGE